jgi:hypothetical protein
MIYEILGDYERAINYLHILIQFATLRNPEHDQVAGITINC